MTGLSCPIGNLAFVFLIFVVYLGHGIFHEVAVMFLSKICFWERSQVHEWRYFRQKVVRFYRSARYPFIIAAFWVSSSQEP